MAVEELCIDRAQANVLYCAANDMIPWMVDEVTRLKAMGVDTTQIEADLESLRRQMREARRILGV